MCYVDIVLGDVLCHPQSLHLFHFVSSYSLSAAFLRFVLSSHTHFSYSSWFSLLCFFFFFYLIVFLFLISSVCICRCSQLFSSQLALHISITLSVPADLLTDERGGTGKEERKAGVQQLWIIDVGQDGDM